MKDNKTCLYEDLDFICMDCSRVISPYGEDNCGCYTRVPRCIICGEPITPYNTHEISYTMDLLYHDHCTFSSKIYECACGAMTSPFSTGKHNRCHHKIRNCKKCGDRITPYLIGVYGNFCSIGCRQDHLGRRRNPSY